MYFSVGMIIPYLKKEKEKKKAHGQIVLARLLNRLDDREKNHMTTHNYLQLDQNLLSYIILI